MESNFVVADSLLRGAETEDPSWDEPTIARANLAYRRTRLIRRDPVVIKQWIDSGVALVNRALLSNAENADALELRGNLNYWGWLVGIEADPKKANDLLTGARADFEKATTLNPRQAGAWASLSHLYYQVGTGVDINLAARRALESDAFLSNANVILDRLFLSSYDLGNFADAEQWCKEGERRFPERFESARCRLQLLTTRAKTPDVPRAWTLADSMVALTPEQRRPLQTLHAHMLVAAVLARDGKADSARAVVKRSLGNAEIDPSRDLTYTGAFVYTLLGDKENALQLLKTYLAANPRRRNTLAQDPGWWFRPLETDPGFKVLVADS
jgi:tetratricopeptide (TPR) repeat protein